MGDYTEFQRAISAGFSFKTATTGISKNPDMISCLFKALDINNDTFLTFDEYLRAYFTKATPTEINTYVAWAYPHKKEKVIKDETDIAVLVEEARMIFNSLDTDHNGLVTKT